MEMWNSKVQWIINCLELPLVHLKLLKHAKLLKLTKPPLKNLRYDSEEQSHNQHIEVNCEKLHFGRSVYFSKSDKVIYEHKFFGRTLVQL